MENLILKTMNPKRLKWVAFSTQAAGVCILVIAVIGLLWGLVGIDMAWGGRTAMSMPTCFCFFIAAVCVLIISTWLEQQGQRIAVVQSKCDEMEHRLEAIEKQLSK